MRVCWLIPWNTEEYMQPDERISQITHEPPLQLGFGLCQAFYEEPNFTFTLPDTRVRRVALPWFLGRFVI
jgi:hypothetical protein